MKPTSKYEQEINRMTNVERAVIAVVIVIVFLIFSIISYEREKQDAVSSRAKQEEMK